MSLTRRRGSRQATKDVLLRVQSFPWNRVPNNRTGYRRCDSVAWRPNRVRYEIKEVHLEVLDKKLLRSFVEGRLRKIEGRASQPKTIIRTTTSRLCSRTRASQCRLCSTFQSLTTRLWTGLTALPLGKSTGRREGLQGRGETRRQRGVM